MFRYQGRAWEERFLPRLSAHQIGELPKDNALVVLPIGAIEQHGAHLPIMTDTLIAETVVTQTFERLPQDSQIWLIPPLAYGKSNEHLDFPGTISLSSQTLQGMIVDIALSLHRSGFRRLLLLNTHGGNVDLLNMAAREVRVLCDLMVFYLSPGALGAGAFEMDHEEREYGIHGGEVETSQILSIKPEWVNMALAEREIPDVTDCQYLTMEGKIRFAWVMSDLSTAGTLGDARKGTVAKGEATMDRIAERLTEALQEIALFDIRSVKQKLAVVSNRESVQ